VSAREHTSGNSPGAGRRYPGVYLGYVTRILDPRKMGRVKLRVPEIGGQHELAWARVPLGIGGKGTGSFSALEVGALVQVIFEADDANRPVVIGAASAQEGETSSLPAAALGETDPDRAGRGTDTASGAGGATITEPADPYDPTYPSNRVLKTPGKHLVEIDDTPGKERISVTHGPSKSWFEFHPDGTLVFGVKGRRYAVVEGDDAEHVKGRQDVVVDDEITVKSGGPFRRTAQAYTLLSLGKLAIEAIGNFVFKGQALKAKFAAASEIVAPTLDLGPGVAAGNVVTTLTHPVCYITGIPILGTPTVRAG